MDLQHELSRMMRAVRDLRRLEMPSDDDPVPGLEPYADDRAPVQDKHRLLDVSELLVSLAVDQLSPVLESVESPVLGSVAEVEVVVAEVPVAEPALDHVKVPEGEPDQELLDKYWADAMLAMAPAPWEIKQPQAEEEFSGGCWHDFVFNSAVGTVCQNCGLIKLHIRDTFEFRRPYKRRRAAKKNQREDKTVNAKVDPGRQEEEARQDDERILTNQCEGLMYPHQKEGFNFLCNNLLGNNPGGAILAHAPGVGKSFVAVSFIQSYFHKFPGERALMVVPKIVQNQWVAEFAKWKMAEIAVYSCLAEEAATRPELVNRWFSGGGVMIISHPLLTYIIGKRQDRYLEVEEGIRDMLKRGPNVLVVDEAHCARNDDTQVFLALEKIGTHRRIFLTGTLFQNNFEELMNSFKLCRPDFLNCPEFVEFVRAQQGDVSDSSALRDKFFKTEFEKKIMNKNDDYTMEERVSSVLMLRRLTSKFLSWNSGDVLRNTLKGLQDFVLVLNMEEAHQAAYMRVRGSLDFPDSLKHECSIAISAIHPCLATSDSRPTLTGQDPVAGVKTNFIMQLVRYCYLHNEKIIIFSQWLQPLRLLHQMINSYEWGSIALPLEGKDSPSERQRVIDEFSSKTSNVKVLLASISACGEGITLVAASRVVILDTAWNPSKVQQAVARAHRIGQKRKVYVYRLLASGTLEAAKHCTSMVKFVLCKQLLDPAVDPETMISLVDSDGEALCEPLMDMSGDDFLDTFILKNRELCQGVYTLQT